MLPESSPQVPQKKSRIIRGVVFLIVGAVAIAALAWGGWHWHVGSVPSLIQQLSGKGPDVRANAADELGNWGPKAKVAVPALVVSLADEKSNVRQKSAQALEKNAKEWFDLPATKDAVSQLIRQTKHDNPEVRLAAVETLGKLSLNAKDAVPALIERIKDRETRVHFGAWHALKKFDMSKQDIVPTLPDALIALVDSDYDPVIRAHAMLILSDLWLVRKEHYARTGSVFGGQK